MFLPQVAADDSTPMQTEQSLKSLCKLFLRCYIESSTTPDSYEDPGRCHNFGIGLYCIYGGNSKTTVYDEKMVRFSVNMKDSIRYGLHCLMGILKNRQDIN